MPNVYRTLLNLLPQRPLLVADVVALDGPIRILRLPGGGTLRARGDAAAGERVFVRDGVIEGTAPALPIVNLAV
jgi:hypothetical protein